MVLGVAATLGNRFKQLFGVTMKRRPAKQADRKDRPKWIDASHKGAKRIVCRSDKPQSLRDQETGWQRIAIQLVVLCEYKHMSLA